MTRRTRPFRSILVPLDGSLFAEQALPWALAIGRAARSKVRLVRVHQSAALPISVEAARYFNSMDQAVRRSERKYLREVAGRLRRSGGPGISSALLAGPVTDTLTQYVHDSRADLVVMTTHGRGPLQRVWLGSVADHLIRHLQVPVLLIRPRERPLTAKRPPAIKRMMVPLDGSSLAEAALTPAAALARLLDIEVVLLEVVAPLLVNIPPMGPPSIGFYEQGLKLVQSEAEEYLQAIAKRLGQEGLAATSRVVLGPEAAGTILEVARHSRVGLVTIATRGQGGIRRLALGSVADKVVRGAEIPVLVIRPAKISSKTLARR
jgi:nucleotide-binding universal stress UspA family protein